MGAGEDYQRASQLRPVSTSASHADRQVRTPKLPPTELCIEPVPGRQLRRGACVEAERTREPPLRTHTCDMIWRAPGALSEEVVSRETGCGVQLVA